jgi:adenylate cyclase class IV
MQVNPSAAKPGPHILGPGAPGRCEISVPGRDAPVTRPKHQEKKYRVDSFDRVLRKLHDAGAKSEKENKSEHYYTHQSNNDVIKLVVHGDKAEIHKLKERNGKFDLDETIPLKDTQAGFGWLRQQGYKTLDVVRMAHQAYDYKGGIVRLYTINDFLYSVILDYPQGQHETVAAELGLQKTERIDVPYNTYLHRIGELEAINLE